MAPPLGMQRVLNVLAALGAAGAIAHPKGAQARDMLTWESSLDHPGFGATPQSMLATFREAECGFPRRQCNLFDDFIEGDAHARSLFEKREEAVAGKPGTIQAGGAGELDEQVARMMRYALGRLGLRGGATLLELHRHLLKFNRYGWAAAEMEWDVLDFEGRAWIAPVKVTLHPSRRFRIVTPEVQRALAVFGEKAELNTLRIFNDPARPYGDALEPWKWIVLRRDGDLARAGLMRTGAWNCLAKKLGFADWIILSQRYGLPTPIATYKTQGEHADDKAIDVAYEIVAKIGTDGGAAVPDTVTLDLKKAFEGDGAKMQGSLIAYANSENSKLVNGAVLANDTSGSGGGASYALANVHDDVRWESVLIDAVILQLAIGGQVFEPAMLFNGLVGLAGTPVLFIQIVRDLTPAALVNIAALLSEMGVKISIEQLRSVTGFREPSSDKDAAPGIPPKIAPDPAPAPKGAQP